MDLLNLQSRSLAFDVAVFCCSAAVVWIAGSYVARLAAVIAGRTRLGDAVLGTVLLGAIVSLPELTMAAAAAALGEAELAVNTLLGGIVFATLTLVITDAIVGRGALSADVKRPVAALAGTLVVFMLVLVASAIAVGDVAVAGIGAWSWGLWVVYAMAVLFIERDELRRSWSAARSYREDDHPAAARERRRAERLHHASMRRIVGLTVFAALAIVAAGFVSEQAAVALIHETDLDAGLLGFVLGGVVTSLPEVSSAIAAGRLRRYDMAFSDAFGTNLFSVALIPLCDALYRGGPVLDEAGTFALLASLLGAAVTAVFVAGLLFRSPRAVLRIGIDSWLVLALSIGGLVLLARMQ